jgi:hypothetical protein
MGGTNSVNETVCFPAPWTSYEVLTYPPWAQSFKAKFLNGGLWDQYPNTTIALYVFAALQLGVALVGGIRVAIVYLNQTFRPKTLEEDRAWTLATIQILSLPGMVFAWQIWSVHPQIARFPVLLPPRADAH